MAVWAERVTCGASLYLNSKPNRRLRWEINKSSSAPEWVDPGIGFRGSQRPEDHLQGKSLPRRAHSRMGLQRPVVADVYERVQDPGVAQIDLGGFHLPFADGRVPRLQLSNHVGRREDVEVGSHGLVRQPHGAG